ncbi:hypothetical protein T265_10267 [Opisthorchis viverrini]|uniref:Uncharacterized protein n=1 Tax=Opisthorchis viverrini TaxID=6198 RepID=A0A075A1V8_OPIVI|nr:hypothetical protein T265_10267 [Opisthorchis viverrini]KER21394.1 hypothetical protein T265_10267 [Opisthorchis viverrini]
MKCERTDGKQQAFDQLVWLKKRSTALTLDESMRAGIIPGFSSLDRGIPEAEVEFESRTF